MWSREIFVVIKIALIEHLYVYGNYTIMREKLMMRERRNNCWCDCP